MVRSKEYRMSIDLHPCFVHHALSLDCPITGRENISPRPSIVGGVSFVAE